MYKLLYQLVLLKINKAMLKFFIIPPKLFLYKTRNRHFKRKHFMTYLWKMLYILNNSKEFRIYRLKNSL